MDETKPGVHPQSVEDIEALRRTMALLEAKGLQKRVITQEAFQILESALAWLREHRPQERSDEARAWAVSITEMEKVVAYFRVYVAHV